MVEALKKSGKISRKGPVVLVIMDGVGIGKYKEGDAVAAAVTKNLEALKNSCPYTQLKAHDQRVAQGYVSNRERTERER